MLDIWMIFAMIVPFAEVAMHALNQHLKKRKISPTMSLAKKDTPFSVATLSQYLLPLVSVFFSIGFWLVGVILSHLRWNFTLHPFFLFYSFNNFPFLIIMSSQFIFPRIETNTHVGKYSCLSIDLK